MKSIFTLLLLQSSLLLFSQNSNKAFVVTSPLALYSSEWNDVKYSKCNTAVNVPYLRKSEKDIIYILNLIRSYPALFAKTVLAKYPVFSGKDHLTNDTYYFKSLVDTLLTMSPIQILYPDKACYISAKSHAYQSGITGYVGHVRKTNDAELKKHYYGECCDYGNSDALEIVLSLLIDEGVPSLGHRFACLANYAKIGVSIQPHKTYGTNAVLDFYY